MPSIRSSIASGLLAVCCAAGPAGAAPFQPIGPFGGSVVDLIADPGDPGRIYAGLDRHGVYVSTDGGATWTPSRTGLPVEAGTGLNRMLYDLAADPADGRLYALVEPTPHVSDDGGATWQALPYPGTANGAIQRIVVMGGDLLVVATGPSGNGVFRSTDRGQTWSPANAGIVSPKLDDLVASADASVLYAVSRGTLHRSLDAALSWEARGPLPAGTYLSLAVSPDVADRLYLAVHGGAYRSEDGGATWERVDDPEAPAAITRFLEGERVLAAGMGRLFTMDVGGDVLAAGAPFHHTRTTAFVPRPDGGVLLGTRMGVFVLSADGFGGNEPPEFTSRGILATDIMAIGFARQSGVLYAATGSGYEAGVFRTEDGGETWELRSSGIDNLDLRSIAVAPSNPDILYAGSVDATDETGRSGQIYKSVDGGQTWLDVTGGIDHEGPHIIISIVIHPTNPDVVYASVQGLFGGVYKTSDGGATWQRRAQGLESMPPPPPELGSSWDGFVDYFAVLSQVIDPRDPERIYAGGGGCWGGVYITENGAAEWIRRDERGGSMEEDYTVLGWGDEPVFGIHLELFDIDIDPQNPDRILASGARGRYPEGNPQWGIIFESVDAGATWRLIREGNRGLEKADYFTYPITGLAIHPLDGQRLYIATRDGVKTSPTGGEAGSWKSMNDGLGPRELFTRTLGFDPDDPSRLYIGTLTGVWVRELDPTPVRLLAYDAVWEDGTGVRLSWAVAEPTNHAGFRIDRIDVSGAVTRLTRELVVGENPTWLDPNPPRGGLATYRLVEVDRDGRETLLGVRDVYVPAAARLALGAARPNPASGPTALTLSVGARERVLVQVFDARGRVVATLLDEVLEPGDRELRWNPAGRDVVEDVSGVYFISARTASERITRKVLTLP